MLCLVNDMRKYLVFYFSPDSDDWEYQRIKAHPQSVKGWLRDFESSGFSHAYEVQL